MKYVQTDPSWEVIRSGLVKLGEVDYRCACAEDRVMASSLHLMISNNRQFDIESSNVSNARFGVVTYGITPIPNFINIRPAILKLLNSYRRLSIGFGWIRFG
jgi:hypothetical protein